MAIKAVCEGGGDGECECICVSVRVCVCVFACVICEHECISANLLLESLNESEPICDDV